MAESGDRLNGMKCLGITLAAGVLLCACQTKSPSEDGDTGEVTVEKVRKKKGLAAEVESSGADLGFLMTMSWTEAQSISAQSMEIPPFFRVAAETIEVLKYAPDGRPLGVRAKGNVFIEMLFKDVGRVLCREVYISEQEVIMRGKPLLQRGGSVVEGVDDLTVFYMVGPKLRVIGRHRLKNELQMLAAATTDVSSARSGARGAATENFATLPGVAPAMPKLGPWTAGPNPLLPPLSPATVSDEVRKQMRAEAEAVEVMPLNPLNESPSQPLPQGPPIPIQPKLELIEPPSGAPEIAPTMKEPES